jgi:phage terminase large subunit-like protein
LPRSEEWLKKLLGNPSAIEAEWTRRTSNFNLLYPDSGPYRRELYSKHLDFFAKGAKNIERAALGGNRSGKTTMGAYEATVHATGLYPSWWAGHRFARPNSGWVAGDTSKTVREIIQEKLVGKPTRPGTGMIPEHLIVNRIAKAGVSEAIETLYVRHITGGTSIITFKSYDQKRISFQGTAQDWIWLDEEVEEAIYTECVMRTMKTSDFSGGIVFLTFTPLMGISGVVQLYLPDGVNPSPDRAIVFVGWDDVPHLDEKEKAERIRKIPPYQRDARTKGIPQLGAGAIYPIPEDEIIVAPFPIPKHFRRCYALDVGGGYSEVSTGGTGAIWGAQNPDTQVVYLYDEYFRAGAEPSIHAAAIKARGAWIPGVIDPAARGRSQIDGRQLFQMYTDLGLNLTLANNAVEAGIYEVWDALSGGMLKVFRTCERWRAERNLYRRDAKGRIVKEKDHLLDGTRYLWLSGRDVMVQQPGPTQAASTVRRGGPMGFAR